MSGFWIIWVSIYFTTIHQQFFLHLIQKNAEKLLSFNCETVNYTVIITIRSRLVYFFLQTIQFLQSYSIWTKTFIVKKGVGSMLCPNSSFDKIPARLSIFQKESRYIFLFQLTYFLKHIDWFNNNAVRSIQELFESAIFNFFSWNYHLNILFK